ncbi:Hypp1822 [Branchiostoma lanceolatum]|uniref:Hypp1822 protein n=1 Tax=Branchiostoma lanceolatum TaxID=7740 RepID=A0A8J9ZNK4_BRALA|nr:Hypp1822 [Branchiostoma lanceolatum]
MASMDIQVPVGKDGGQSYKNLSALLNEIIGILGLALNLSMLGDVDDIVKCTFTSVIYFIGIGLSGLFFILTVSRLCGYKGIFNAHPFWRASTFLYTCCCGDGCDGMTDYREGALQDRHVLAYIFLSVLIPGELIPLVASYIDHVNGYVKAVGLKIELPAALWCAIIGRPIVALAKVFYAGYNVNAQAGCSTLFKYLLGLGIGYIVILVVLYGLAFGHVFDGVCPRFFMNETMTNMTMMNETLSGM